MKIVIISNITNGIGLQRDSELLCDWLMTRYHSVMLQPYDKPAVGTGFDLAIFLETMNEHLVPMASQCWYIANPEWLRPEYVRLIQRYCSLVIAKTRDAESLLRPLFSRVVCTGFLTADVWDTSIPRLLRCLHIGGNSGHRGTNSIVMAWRDYRYWDSFPLPPLTVISNSRETAPIPDTPGITFIKRATDAELRELQNSHLFHLYPSAYEGWGHALHEAQSVGAILLTTQAAPMTEFGAAFHVLPSRTRKAHLATLHDVSPQSIRETIPRMLSLPNYEIARMQLESRSRFARSNAFFSDKMSSLLEELDGRSSQIPVVVPSPISSSTDPARPVCERVHSPLTQRRIALLGNFRPLHSTENDLAWTLRDLGHHVTEFQEDSDSTDSILTHCTSNHVDLLLYVHTHGWITPGRLSLDDLWVALHEQGITTASLHLDRFWGLNAIDKREDRIGDHPFWKTNRVFTADGGNQRGFTDRGINHHWLPPGVVKRDCVPGTRQPSLCVDVGFVGAETYHPEYPFRGQLIEFLRSAYSDRFRLFSGYRGQALNDLYASVRVVVGDSCFGGAEYYWSDRVPETLGRGGFLIHPATRGLGIPGLVTFTPGNLHELQDTIDYYLDHESERNHLQCAAHHWVLAHDTYHNRMTTLLKECGL